MQFIDENVLINPILTTDNKTSNTLIMITPKEGSDIKYPEWLKANKKALEEGIHNYGGILFRNFKIDSVSEFNKAVQSLYPDLLDYVYRSTPRTNIGGKIYTATEYPADKTIPFHNENSYTKSWPKRICFYCAIAPKQNGETPIADSRVVYKKIDDSVKQKFEAKGVLYVRNYNKGIDLSWEEVFQTDNKDAVSKFCADNDIEAIWNKTGPELTTKQKCQATYIHPLTNEKVWFNQAHLFHASALSDNDLDILLNEVGEHHLPRNTFYGDGEPIELEVLEHIREIYEKEKVKFQWKRRDLMILDNVLTAHAREPFVGDRKIVVAMA